MSALQWFNVLCDSLLVVEVLVTAVLMFGWIRTRHDGSLFWVFLLFGVALASFGIYHGLVITIWLTNPFAGDNHWWFTALILVKGLCVLTWTPMTALLLWSTPGVMRVPSVKELAKRVREQSRAVTEMERRQLLKTEDSFIKTKEELAEALAEIQKLRDHGRM